MRNKTAKDILPSLPQFHPDYPQTLVNVGWVRLRGDWVDTKEMSNRAKERCHDIHNFPIVENIFNFNNSNQTTNINKKEYSSCSTKTTQSAD